MMSMLNPNQKQQANLFQNKSRKQQAQIIADKANELGLKKEDLEKIVNMINNKK